jgi:hypothetical protein
MKQPQNFLFELGHYRYKGNFEVQDRLQQKSLESKGEVGHRKYKSFEVFGGQADDIASD